MNVFWFLPTHGDGHFLGTPDGGRAITFAYLRRVAQAADDLGFGGVPPVQKPYPPLYFGGTSEPAREVAALKVAPNLWAGVGLVRHGAGTALVGDPETVAARMHAYAEMGIDTFILSGYPHLEEAYRVAELLFPRLQRTGAQAA